MHLSHPRSESINEFIPKEFTAVCYKSFDVVIKLCLKHGRSSKVTKTDLDSTYRHLPMLCKALLLLGIHIDDQFYIESCLPFGAAESCAIFEKFSS